MFVAIVEMVDFGFGFFVFAAAGFDVFIQDGVGKAEVVFVGLAAETIGRGFVEKVGGESEFLPDSQHFIDSVGGQRRDVAGTVAVFGAVADIVFGAVAGVDDAPAAWDALGDGVERCHAEPWREILLQGIGDGEVEVVVDYGFGVLQGF